MNHESLWKKLILALTRITIVYSIVSIAVVALAFRFLVPLFLEHIPGIWGRLLAAVVIILFISPFLRAIMIKRIILLSLLLYGMIVGGIVHHWWQLLLSVY